MSLTIGDPTVAKKGRNLPASESCPASYTFYIAHVIPCGCSGLDSRSVSLCMLLSQCGYERLNESAQSIFGEAFICLVQIGLQLD